MNDSSFQTGDTGSVSADNMKAVTLLLSASTMTGDDVYNLKNEEVGKIQDIMFDIAEGEIRYAVLAAGGFLGMGDRLFAVPWNALKHDESNRRFILDVDVERLKDAPGFDKDQWPNMADTSWSSTVETFYTR